MYCRCIILLRAPLLINKVWAVGLDSCDDMVSILKRDLATGTLTPTALISTYNPSGNTINIDKVRTYV